MNIIHHHLFDFCEISDEGFFYTAPKHKRGGLFSMLDLKVGSWGFKGTIILTILFSKLLESTFYKEISKFQQKV